MNPTNCDAGKLSLLLADGLPPEQHDAVLDHLDSCPGCQRRLEDLAAGQEWWRDLRHVGEPETAPADLALTVSSLLRGAALETLPTADGTYLGFLDPTDEPGCLGSIGPFVVTAVLGQGGFGIVLGAYDAELDRPVAVKVLSPHLAGTAAARDRFAREARAAAAVVHPHVVPIHGVDSFKGLPYLVMSQVAGRSLQERLADEGPLPVAEVLRIGAQAAAGLAAAHEKGLVHRDVKPANILLEAGSGRVLLTDFGLARSLDEAGPTQSGVIAGTPAYMAPEQARGEPADHRADLFSLGSTLYAACAGVPPFGCDAPLAVLRRDCEGRPAPLRTLNPDVPPWLEGFVGKLLAVNPKERFASAAEVGELLTACLAHVERPGSAPLPPAVRRLSPRRRWLRGGLVAGLLLAGLIVAAAPLLYAWRERPVVPARQAKPPAAGQGLDRTPEEQLQMLQRQAKELEDQLKQPSGEGPDPAAEMLRDVRRRLDALERDLGGPKPAPMKSPVTPNKGSKS